MTASGGHRERLVRVRVRTGARRESVRESEKDVVEISVKEPAKGGRANARALALLAAHLSVRQQTLRIISGHHRASKLVRLIR